MKLSDDYLRGWANGKTETKENIARTLVSVLIGIVGGKVALKMLELEHDAVHAISETEDKNE